MTPAALIPALEAAGVRLFLTDAGGMGADVPDPAPDEVAALLEEVRRHRDEILRLLAPPCTSCGDPVAGAEAVLCQTCLEARLARRLLPFDPDRRRRTEAALATRTCSACGWSWWQVDHRGDSHCVVCRELEAGRAPRCGTCQRTDGWETVDGRKACTHAPVAVVPTRPADGEPCSTCQATRWTSHPPAVPGGPALFLCHGGHYWTASRPAQDAQPGAGTAPSQEIEPGAARSTRAAALFAPREVQP